MTHLWSTVQCRTLYFMAKVSLLRAGMNPLNDACSLNYTHTWYVNSNLSVRWIWLHITVAIVYCIRGISLIWDLCCCCSMKECFGGLTFSILDVLYFFLVVQGNTSLVCSSFYFLQFVFLLTDDVTYVLFCWFTVPRLWIFSAPQFLLILKEDPPEQ